MKKRVAIVLTTLLLLGAVCANASTKPEIRSFIQEPVAQRLPDGAEATIDRQHYYRQFLHGYYQFDCVVSQSVVRSAKIYVPEGAAYNQPTVFIGVPGGENPWDFMLKSGWKELSDLYGLYLVLMEAEGNSWDKGQADIDYLNALVSDLSYRPMFCTFQASFYAAAYGDAADPVGRQSRKSPRAYAAIALVGTKGLSADEENMLKSSETRVSGVTYAQVQYPVWLVNVDDSEDAKRQIEYYKAANHSVKDGLLDGSRTIWVPQKGGTVDEYWCAKVIVDNADWKECINRGYSEVILAELFNGIYRYPGNNNGALRASGNIYARGFRKFSADVWGGYCADKRDTYRREWYVYVPASAPKGEKLPLVFVYHGAGGSGDEIADRIGWSYVANKYGFMIVAPTASLLNKVREVSNIRTNEIFRAMWNTGYPQPEFPDDMRFLDFLYNWVIENYPVDRSRVYASGQSSGGMMTWASAAYRPDYFAAVAPFSAPGIGVAGNPNVTDTSVVPVESSKVAITANLGRCDATFKGGFSNSENIVDYWVKRYSLTKKWSEYSYSDGGKNCSFKDGLISHYIFNTADGVPMLHLTETDTKAHAAWPSECEMVWTTFLNKFTKDPETKELFYEGKSVK